MKNKFEKMCRAHTKLDSVLEIILRVCAQILQLYNLILIIRPYDTMNSLLLLQIWIKKMKTQALTLLLMLSYLIIFSLKNVTG